MPLTLALIFTFNLSFDAKVFREVLKSTGRTIPIFKSGHPNVCDNHGPISLLNSIFAQHLFRFEAKRCELFYSFSYNVFVSQRFFFETGEIMDRGETGQTVDSGQKGGWT